MNERLTSTWRMDASLFGGSSSDPDGHNAVINFAVEKNDQELFTILANSGRCDINSTYRALCNILRYGSPTPPQQLTHQQYLDELVAKHPNKYIYYSAPQNPITQTDIYNCPEKKAMALLIVNQVNIDTLEKYNYILYFASLFGLYDKVREILAIDINKLTNEDKKRFGDLVRDSTTATKYVENFIHRK